MIAGGMENMSNALYGMTEARWGYRMNMPYGQIVDLMVYDGLLEIFNGYHMGMTAENIAEMYKISRKEQDEYALVSHQRAIQANKSGAVADEIVPVVIPQKKGEPLVFKVDERPMDTNLEKMAKLGTAFKKGGTITAANASGINDGAAAHGHHGGREGERARPQTPCQDPGLFCRWGRSRLHGAGSDPGHPEAVK